MDKRYIDLELANKWVCRTCEVTEGTLCFSCDDNPLGFLEEKDVVKVVRCKDCKFWLKDRISVEGLARCQTGETGIRYRKATDFCSRGDVDNEYFGNDNPHSARKTV